MYFYKQLLCLATSYTWKSILTVNNYSATGSFQNPAFALYRVYLAAGASEQRWDQIPKW